MAVNALTHVLTDTYIQGGIEMARELEELEKELSCGATVKMYRTDTAVHILADDMFLGDVKNINTEYCRYNARTCIWTEDAKVLRDMLIALDLED
jgi:hypothetical protein